MQQTRRKKEATSSIEIVCVLSLFEPGYIYYLFEPGGAKLPHTLINLKNAYIPMKLTQNKVIDMKF